MVSLHSSSTVIGPVQPIVVKSPDAMGQFPHFAIDTAVFHTTITVTHDIYIYNIYIYMFCFYEQTPAPVDMIKTHHMIFSSLTTPNWLSR